MDSYRKLKFEELKSQYYKELEVDWARTAQDLNLKGLFYSSVHINLFLQSGFGYIDKLIEDLFKSENKVLSSGKTIEDGYFTNLKRDIEELILSELTTIRSHALKSFKPLMGYGNDDDYIISEVQKKEQLIIESLERKIALLKHEFEDGTLHPLHSGTQIRVTGNVGMINTGQMQINGSLEIKLADFRKAGQVELFNAFSALIQTIKESDTAEKDVQIENVDFLLDQCNNPKEKRKHGVIKTIERVLSNAANLSTIWGQVGPTIMNALS